MQEMQDPMESSTVPGTEGYAENAGQLIARYDNVTFLDKYRPVSHLLPTISSAVLDIGAGTGGDAAWLASSGHKVTALEPVAAFRAAGMKAHALANIEWVNDSLPALSTLGARLAREGRRIFDVSANETIDLAMRYQLKLMLSTQAPSVQQQNRQAGVSWSWIVFEK